MYTKLPRKFWTFSKIFWTNGDIQPFMAIFPVKNLKGFQLIFKETRKFWLIFGNHVC